MHHTTFSCYSALAGGHDHLGLGASLLSSLHLHVSLGVAKAAEAFADREIYETGVAVVPIGSWLPSSATTMTIDGQAEHCYLLLEYLDIVHVWQIDVDGNAYRLGYYKPGSEIVGSDADLIAIGIDTDSQHGFIRRKVGIIGFLVSLINEPRRVSVSKATGPDWTRQYQKQIQRKTGMAVMAYSTVSWQVGAGVKAKGNPNEKSDLKVALHYSRPHWRTCEADNENAVWVKSIVSGEAGWHQWVVGSWKGHPDHGIKLQRYEPRMIGEQRNAASRYAARVGNDSKASLECMSAEIRAKLVQAGFAATEVVH